MSTIKPTTRKYITVTEAFLIGTIFGAFAMMTVLLVAP